MESSEMTAKSNGARKVPNVNAAPNIGPAPTPQQDVDWQAESQFWQLKYFEQLLHSTQVITALGRPMLGQVQQLRQQAAQQAANLAAAQ